MCVWKQVCKPEGMGFRMSRACIISYLWTERDRIWTVVMTYMYMKYKPLVRPWGLDACLVTCQPWALRAGSGGFFSEEQSSFWRCLKTIFVVLQVSPLVFGELQMEADSIYAEESSGPFCVSAAERCVLLGSSWTVADTHSLYLQSFPGRHACIYATTRPGVCVCLCGVCVWTRGYAM